MRRALIGIGARLRSDTFFGGNNTDNKLAYVAVAGRVLIAAIFIWSGVWKIDGP